MKLSCSNTKVLCNCSNPTCINCHTKIQINMGDDNGLKGNIYSEAGIREFQISKLCETCFDEITKEED